MSIDMKKLAGAPGIRCTVRERWAVDGHDVALVEYRRKGGRKPGNSYLACECDTDTEDVIRDGKVIGRTHRRDPHKCAAKAAVRAQVTERVRPSCLETLAKDGIEAAVAGTHARVNGGEWLGQAHQGVIYAQEVASLLQLPLPAVLKAVEALYAKELLDLNGMILCDFVPGFRFPKEVRSMLRMLIEAPLGWPNGDAGDIALAEMEAAITKGTRYARCADAFWDHNWPRVAPSHLVEFGLTFLDGTLARAASDETSANDLRYFDCERLASHLERLASGYRALGAARGFPKDPAKEAASTDGKNATTKKTRPRRKTPKKQ